jgi:hypothetical protein
MGYLQINDHPNSKIPDESLPQLLDKLYLESDTFSNDEDPDANQEMPILEEKTEHLSSESNEIAIPTESNVNIDAEEIVQTVPEVIKPVIPILTGPKVIGKIELSEHLIKKSAPRPKKVRLTDDELTVKKDHRKRERNRSEKSNEMVFSDELRQKQIEEETAKVNEIKQQKKQKAREKHLQKVKIGAPPTPSKKNVPILKKSKTPPVYKDLPVKKQGLIDRISSWFLHAD